MVPCARFLSGITTDNYVFCSIQNLDSSVWMPDGKVSGMQHATRKQFLRGIGVLIIAFCADIPIEDNFSDFFPVLFHINDATVRQPGFDDSHWKAGDKSVALSRHILILRLQWDSVPFWHVIGFGYRAICLCHAIHMDGLQIQVCHLFEEVSGWWTSRNSHSYGIRK